jgi:alkanesulfonate monooxygenase SsuD/methylene tetrahydromethanopterin reductase-like flavin-dependent oxidoreductase (luciferase family)
MLVDLLLDPFGATWDGARDAAVAAEQSGFDGIWTWDHLAGQAHGRDGVLEGWTLLTALAAAVPRVALGPLVLNVANRRPGQLATMAATLQQISGGRLLLGLGAGGGGDLPYAAEQRALGTALPPDPVRRAQVVEAVTVLRRLWSGRATAFDGEHYQLGEAEGFLQPDPPPPIIIGGFGPKMATIAGEVGDGFNTSAAAPQLGPLVDTARAAHEASERAGEPFLITTFARLDDRWLTPGAALDRMVEVGVDRLALVVSPPFDHAAIEAAGARLPR